MKSTVQKYSRPNLGNPYLWHMKIGIHKDQFFLCKTPVNECLFDLIMHYKYDFPKLGHTYQFLLASYTKWMNSDCFNIHASIC